jgi:hypothetical protein
MSLIRLKLYMPFVLMHSYTRNPDSELADLFSDGQRKPFNRKFARAVR